VFHFIGEMKRSKRRCYLFNFKRSVRPFYHASQIQTFNFSDSPCPRINASLALTHHLE
jgi:hypothetical protein